MWSEVICLFLFLVERQVVDGGTHTHLLKEVHLHLVQKNKAKGNMSVFSWLQFDLLSPQQETKIPQSSPPLFCLFFLSTFVSFQKLSHTSLMISVCSRYFHLISHCLNLLFFILFSTLQCCFFLVST